MSEFEFTQEKSKAGKKPASNHTFAKVWIAFALTSFATTLSGVFLALVLFGVCVRYYVKESIQDALKVRKEKENTPGKGVDGKP